MEISWREIDSDEVKSFSALAEESSKTVESLAPMLDEAVIPPSYSVIIPGALHNLASAVIARLQE